MNYKTASDTQLLFQLKSGNHLAFSEIYNRHSALVICFVLKKTGIEDIAKDLVQDLFAQLWDSRSSLVMIDNLPAYLVTVAKRRIINLYAHDQVKMKYAASLAKYHLNHCNAPTDHRIREKQFADHINDQINNLPEKMRQAFVMSRMQYLSNKEIAEQLSTTEGNVSKHVHAALRILRTKLHVLLFFLLY